MKQTIIIVGLVVVLVVILRWEPDKTALADCLTEQGFRMYGTSWCAHCQDQKDMFGSAFSHVDYVECSVPGSADIADECALEGIQGYPTWKLPDGSKQMGGMTLEQLQTISGCQI